MKAQANNLIKFRGVQLLLQPSTLTEFPQSQFPQAYMIVHLKIIHKYVITHQQININKSKILNSIKIKTKLNKRKKKLMYVLMCTQPNTAFDAGLVNHYQSNIGPSH